jgi:multidrug efflux pump subunit AcrA (membrane-fusion protein)
MMLYVSQKKTLQPVLAIPKSAILFEEMKTVWVKTVETTFEQRMVKTGAENKSFAEVLSGIREGETAVS